MRVRSLALLKLLTCLALTNSLAACSEKTISSAGSRAFSDTLGIVTDNVCWLGQGADAAASITYADSCQFDRQLRKSLSSSLSEVSIAAGGTFKQNAVPTRLGNWLEKLRSSGGSVVTCTINDGSMGIVAILPLLWDVFGKVKTYALYSPAKNYDAFIVAAKSGFIDKVVFTRRVAASSCPAETTKTSPVA